MSYIDHLKTCPDCRERERYSQVQPQNQKPTVRIKGASTYRRERALSSLTALISGTSYPTISYAGENKEKAKTKAASSISYVEKSQKLKELSRLIRGL